MDTLNNTAQAVLYHVVCAAPPAQYIQDFVRLAQEAHWDVCMIATPEASNFINMPLLEDLNGHPVRSDFKPIVPDSLKSLH